MPLDLLGNRRRKQALRIRRDTALDNMERKLSLSSERHPVRLIPRLNSALTGKPEAFLRMLLLALAAIIAAIGLFGSPLLMASVAAWVIAP